MAVLRKFVDAAMSLMKKHSIIKDAAIDTLHATIVEQKPYFTRWGKPISFELAQEKKFGDFLAKRYYILRHEEYYNVFLLSIYKTAGGWRVTQLTYDDDLIDYVL